jgi:fumarylpyruvate hydrolase
MTDARYVFPPPAPVAVPVAGTDELFPVRRIFCVGRNYAEHAREMGGDPAREPPFFFAKAPDAIGLDGVFPYPPASADVHHEVELVVALGAGGRDIPAERALDAVFGYAVGLDMTRRDRQAEAKKHGRPWEVGKSFERSAPLGPLAPASRIGHPARGRIYLEVNGEPRQDGDLADLIWSVPETIAILSGLFELGAGDLIMTGTPAGVAAVERGDVMRGGIGGVGEIEVRVV